MSFELIPLALTFREHILKNITMKKIFLILFVFSFTNADAQEIIPFKHHHISLTIGHALIPEGSREGKENDMILIPTWGLSYEYLFTEKIGLGLKNDLEISNYIISNENEEELEREIPISTSLVFLYNPVEGLGFFAGPGIEFEKNEDLVIFTIGVSYEASFNDIWDVSPEIAYENKGGHTSVLSVGLSVGIRLGKK